MAPVDVVVCAHNEEATVGTVLAAIRRAPELGRLIVVADACTDRTAEIAWTYAETVVLSHARDKGSAMASGLRYVETSQICFIDADLEGLTTEHVSALLTLPPGHGQVCGLRDGAPIALGALPPITGERRLPTQVAVDADLDGSGWRAEFRINSTASKVGIPWAHYVMHGVRNPRRPKPKEWAQLATGAVEHGRDLFRYARFGRRAR